MLEQWTWATTQPAVQMRMGGAFTMTQGETRSVLKSFCISHNSLQPVHHRQSSIVVQHLWIIQKDIFLICAVCPKFTWILFCPPTVWLQSQRTSFRPIKPMCCSTSAATAPPQPQSGSRPQTGWAAEPIRTTLPPVSIETNKKSSAGICELLNLISLNKLQEGAEEGMLTHFKGAKRWATLRTHKEAFAEIQSESWSSSDGLCALIICRGEGCQCICCRDALGLWFMKNRSRKLSWLEKKTYHNSCYQGSFRKIQQQLCGQSLEFVEANNL